jgi:proteic killer suppression protein
VYGITVPSPPCGYGAPSSRPQTPIDDDDEREIRRDPSARVRRILTALHSAEGIEGLRGPPGWRLHQLTGRRAGTWSISVSGNWRITFELIDNEIHHFDLEDYH